MKEWGEKRSDPSMSHRVTNEKGWEGPEVGPSTASEERIRETTIRVSSCFLYRVPMEERSAVESNGRILKFPSTEVFFLFNLFLLYLTLTKGRLSSSLSAIFHTKTLFTTVKMDEKKKIKNKYIGNTIENNSNK